MGGGCLALFLFGLAVLGEILYDLRIGRGSFVLRGIAMRWSPCGRRKSWPVRFRRIFPVFYSNTCKLSHHSDFSALIALRTENPALIFVQLV